MLREVDIRRKKDDIWRQPNSRGRLTAPDGEVHVLRELRSNDLTPSRDSDISRSTQQRRMAELSLSDGSFLLNRWWDE